MNKGLRANWDYTNVSDEKEQCLFTHNLSWAKEVEWFWQRYAVVTGLVAHKLVRAIVGKVK